MVGVGRRSRGFSEAGFREFASSKFKLAFSAEPHQQISVPKSLRISVTSRLSYYKSRILTVASLIFFDTLSPYRHAI